MPRLAVLLAVAMSAILAFPLAAAGQNEPGVFIDPESPSGREYDIPLEQARRQADPARTGGRVRQGERSSPLFGEGITTPSQKQSGKGAGDGERDEPGAGTPPDRRRERTSRERSKDPNPVVRAAAASPGAPEGGLSTSLLIGGGAVGVIALGAGAGVLMRRRGTP